MHAPSHIREKLLHGIHGEHENFWKNFQSRKELHWTIGQLWICHDIVPKSAREVIADWLLSIGADEVLALRIKRNCSYATLVRTIKKFLPSA